MSIQAFQVSKYRDTEDLAPIEMAKGRSMSVGLFLNFFRSLFEFPIGLF